MEFYEYTLIASMPVILCTIVLLVIFVVCKTLGRWHDLSVFVVFTLFPDILKSKTDDKNDTVVYLRKEKVLLQGNTLKKVYHTLMYICYCLMFYVAIVFGELAFIEHSYDCKDVEQGKDCFINKPEISFYAARANCSDPDIGKNHVVCYRLTFKLELAFGISYGMYRICTVLLSTGSTFIMKINKDRVKCFKLVGSISIIIIYVCALVVLIEILIPRHLFRMGVSSIKILVTCGLVLFTAFVFIVFMPWAEIIKQKKTDEDTEHSLALV